MEKIELGLPVRSQREVACAVPGIERVMADFRAAYPQLSLEAIRGVLRLPPEIKEEPESPRKV